MLVGNFIIEGHCYTVHAYDFGVSISVKLYAQRPEDRTYLDKGIIYGNGDIDYPLWDSLYMSVGSGYITVDGSVEKIDGAKFKSALNSGVLSRFGSILSGMKAGCSRNRLKDTGDLFESGFNPMKVQEYIYENGYITLELGLVRELKYDDGIVQINLEDDFTYEEKIWGREDKNLLKQKFKLDLSDFISAKVEDTDWDFDDGDEDKIFSLQEIIEANPDKDYLWLKSRKYHVVKTIEKVEEVCKKIWNHDGIVAFDTETTGLNINVKSRVGQADRLVGMVFSIESGEAYYFPVAHKHVQNICNAGNEHYIIAKYFKPLLEKKDLLCHNGSYDWSVMYTYGIICNIVHDTFVLFKVTLWNDHQWLKLGLKPLVKRFLNRDSFELSDFVKGKFGKNKVKFWDLEEESVKYYACPDTDSLLDLFNWAMQERLLEKYDAKKVYEMEVLFSLVIGYQQYYGHCVDIGKLDSLSNAIEKDLSESYKGMVEIAGHDFNPASSLQLNKVLFDELGMPVVETTDTGNPSAGKEARKRYLGMKNEDGTLKYPIIKYLSQYKDASTLKSNFVNNIDKFATEDGLMFSEVVQFLETGRVSTKNPNYQGYSDTVKKYIVPRKGYYALDADYSSVEARIMCSMAGCKTMVEKMKDPDMNYHRQKASDMFSVPYEQVTDKLRKMSKGVNFGILYGIGDPNLGVTLFGSKTPENTRKAAKQKKLYYRGMEGLEDFVAVSRMQGVENGYSTTYFKRRRYYDKKKTNRDRIERQSCNARIQGTAADLYKMAMCRLFVEIKNRGWMGKVLISAFVHDECFLEVSKDIDPCVMLKILRRCMMLEIDGWCPLFIGAGFGCNWYQAKHSEIPVQVQEILCNEYGETGYKGWHGNTEDFCSFVDRSIKDYKVKRVKDYVCNKANWGKVLHPVEDDLARSVLKDISNGVEVYGALDNKCTPSLNMVENLKEFCRVFGLLDVFEEANIKNLEEHHSSNTLEVEDSSPEQEENLSKVNTMLMRIKTIGVYQESIEGKRKLYFRFNEKDSALLRVIHDIMIANPGDIEAIAVKSDCSCYSTGLCVGLKAYSQVLQVYLANASMGRR